jgi:nitroimidazol reductase NimA-like FMN-containing flavoprotein (pyridoxamine 5'-phosphate oxidase superfamily)
MEPPRSTEQRKADTLARLASAVDCWVPSGSANGEAYLIPLSFVWHAGQIILATLRESSTVRNLRRVGRMRVALDGTRDVVIVAGDVAIVAQDEIDASAAAAFREAAGFEPHREANTYVYLVLTPRTILAWREENELTGREIMREGQWLA